MDLQLEVNATGDLRATHTALLSAPPIAGGSLQIVSLSKTGTPVKAGEVAMEFDPSAQQYASEQSQSDLQQAAEEITAAKDNAAVQVAEDQTALLKDKFAVRQAELDVSKNDILSAIDAKKNLLALDEAKRALAQLQQDIQSHAASNQAGIAVAMEKQNKARMAMKQAQQNIGNMQVRSPISGLIVVRQNYSALGGMIIYGMTYPEYQPGDQVNPGTVVAQVVDISQMEIGTQIHDTDRANVKAGENVRVTIDALPEETFSGKVKSVAGVAGSNFFFSGPARMFDATIQLDHPDDRLRPGFSAHLVILGDKVPDALSIPRQALFDRDGKPTVYVRTDGGFDQREIKVRYLMAGQAVIDGLRPGTQVALVNPEAKSGGGSAKPSASGPAIGGAL